MRTLIVLVALACGPRPILAAQPVRVVSQTVGTDELLLALAEPGQIAALSHLATEAEFSAVVAQARDYPKLARDHDTESVLAFQPTLVLFADYSRAELVAQVRKTGIKVLVFDRYKSLEDAFANLRTLGEELGAGERAATIITACEARMRDLRARLAGTRRVRVLAPSTYGVIAGADTTFQDLCDHAGAENLAATLGQLQGHAPPPQEQMLSWPVEFVVVAGDNLDAALAPLRAIPPYRFMPAIREDRAVLLGPYQLSCVSHHRIDGYEQLARALHPEAFR
jgi:iron complex transport system substrate-binding protein